MPFTIDPNQARQVGPLLYRAYQHNGIFGSPPPPEHELPEGLERGDRDHLHFISLTSALNYHRDPPAFWAAARETYEDPGTRYLFTPHAVAELRTEKIEDDLAAHGLAKRREKDADIWRRICITLTEDFEGDMGVLLEQADYDATQILSTIHSSKYDFPYLGGTKIGSLWVHFLEDSWQGHPIDNLQEIPIYLSRDVVAATVAIGAVKGPGTGTYDDLEDAVEQVWTEACEGTDYYPMQFYRALSILGERGCAEVKAWPCDRRTDCPAMIFCVEAKPRKDGDEVKVVGPTEIGSPISL